MLAKDQRSTAGPQPTSTYALSGETGNLKIVSFHLNAAHFFLAKT